MMAKDPVIAGRRESSIFLHFSWLLEIEQKLYHWDLFSKLVFKRRHKDTLQLEDRKSNVSFTPKI